MSKAKKRSRPGRRLGRKNEARFPLRRPVLLAALGLCGWAPAGAADFPPTLELSMLDGTNGFRLNGVAAQDRSGRAVSAAGDVNGDGLADLLIGAYGADPNVVGAAGATYVVFGRDTAENPFPPTLDLSSLGTNGFQLNGVAAFDRSGLAVSGAGDVNGDGLADLLIGANGADPNGNNLSGASYVVFGRDTAENPFPATLDLSSLDGTNGFRLNGVAAGDLSGRALSGAGDVNGDGLADLLIGAYRANPNGARSGASYVVFGRDTVENRFPASLELSSLDGTNGFRLNGIAAGDRSGSPVSAAGDVNGDGLADLLIGA
ncbi:MAG: integrin alpha, partial [Gammaproteobacteria bacterium]